MRRSSTCAFNEVATCSACTMSPSDEGLMMRMSVMTPRTCAVPDGPRKRYVSGRLQREIKFQIGKRISIPAQAGIEDGLPRPARPRNQNPCVVLFLLKFLGAGAARIPDAVLRAVAAGLGDFMFFCVPRRRHLILSNLHHAFPEKPLAWHRRMGRESCRRLIETGLLSLATPFLDERRYRRIVAASPELLAAFARHRDEPAATLICSPHLC